jgi:ATP-dependent Clp protease ATP-binding subunit ClpA
MSSSFCASTRIVSPSPKSPSSRRSASGFSISRCSARVRDRLAERGLGLELTDAAKEALAEAGWDPTYGARPLKRAIQRLLENALALRLLEGDFAEGETVRVDAREGELVFEKAGAPEPAIA